MCPLCVWLLSLSIIFSRFIHTMWQYFIFLWLSNTSLFGYTSFVYPSTGEHLGCFSFFAIMNNSTVNNCVQVFVWTSAFTSFFSYWGNFTQHKINHFKVPNIVTFNTFTMWCNHYLCVVPEHLYHPGRKPCTH